ncbi:MAG: CoA transferase [Nocardioides sp.]
MLHGVTVIDLSRALAGPQATMMLGDLGARVIKVELPGGGDDSRGWGPPFVGPDAERPESTYFLSCNRNKESVTVDLKTEDGRRTLEELVRRADVLVENFRTGVLDKLGFSVRRLHELNERLVIASVTGFGHDGPDAHRPGYDQIAQGEAGLMSLTGSPDGEPTKVGVPVGDLLAGMNIAFGIAAALCERHQTGRGRVVRTSLLASLVGAHAFQGTRWTVAGEVPNRAGNHHPSIAPYGLFHAADGPLQVAVGSDGLWDRFAEVLDLDPADPRFAANRDRVRHRDDLTRVVDAILQTEPAAHWLRLLTDAGVPCGKVRTLDEVYAWEQTVSQGLLIEVDHPVIGPVTLPGPALRLDDNPYAGARDRHQAPPRLGEHNESIARWLDRPAPASVPTPADGRCPASNGSLDL